MTQSNASNSLENQNKSPSRQFFAAVDGARPTLTALATQPAASEPRVAGPAGVVADLHPLSNTGCITPHPPHSPSSQPVEFHLDYLSLTIHSGMACDSANLAELVKWILTEHLWSRFTTEASP